MTTHSTRRWVVLAAAALLAGGAAVGAYALWTTAEDAPAAQIRAGSLDVQQGSTVWVEMSPDVAGFGDAIDPDTFLVRQGDIIEARFGFSTELSGDNMVGLVGVEWSPGSAPALPPGVTATYMLYATPAGSPATALMAAPASVGTESTVLADARLVADDDGRTDTFEVVVTFDFAGLDDRFGESSPPQLSELGALTFTLDQIREGDGFQ